MTINNWILLLVCIMFCLCAGAIGSMAMPDMDYTWYDQLNKSMINPPKWLFAPVWTVIFILMGISLFYLIKNRHHEFFSIAISLFLLQFALNILWSFIFFADKSIVYMYIEILVLDAVVLIMFSVFGKISYKAMLYLIPYVIWLGYATYLAYYIFANNV